MSYWKENTKLLKALAIVLQRRGKNTHVVQCINTTMTIVTDAIIKVHRVRVEAAGCCGEADDDKNVLWARRYATLACIHNIRDRYNLWGITLADVRTRFMNRVIVKTLQQSKEAIDLTSLSKLVKKQLHPELAKCICKNAIQWYLNGLVKHKNSRIIECVQEKKNGPRKFRYLASYPPTSAY